jgi:hypothetical protein
MSEIRETGTRLRIGDLLVSRTYVYVILGHFKTKWDPYDTGGREIPLRAVPRDGILRTHGRRGPPTLGENDHV